jgi:hypothetical protein
MEFCKAFNAQTQKVDRAADTGADAAYANKNRSS